MTVCLHSELYKTDVNQNVEVPVAYASTSKNLSVHLKLITDEVRAVQASMGQTPSESEPFMSPAASIGVLLTRHPDWELQLNDIILCCQADGYDAASHAAGSQSCFPPRQHCRCKALLANN